MWFNIIGATLGFIGSVIFSAGLVKPAQQIRDENKTYVGTNPYTLDAALNSQLYYIIGFVLIITGFAIPLGGQLGEVFANGQTLISILFAVVVSCVGYLGTALLYIRRTMTHQKKKGEIAKRVFKSTCRTYIRKMRDMEGKPNAQILFQSAKSNYCKDIIEKASKIPESDNEQEQEVAADLDSTTEPKLFYEVLEKYLSH